MGEVLSTARKTVKESSEEGKKDMAHTLDLLQELAETKANYFYSNLISSDKLKEFHISRVQALEMKTFVKHEDKGVEGVADMVKESVGSIMDKDYLNGITSLVGGALNTVLGSGSGNQSETRKFFVFSRGIGISRVDFYIFYRGVTYSSFTQLSSQVFVVAWAVSSIDVSIMNRADLNQLVSSMQFFEDGNELSGVKLLQAQMEYAEMLAQANDMFKHKELALKEESMAAFKVEANLGDPLLQEADFSELAVKEDSMSVELEKQEVE